MWCSGYRTVVLGKVPAATLVYWCNNGSFKIYWYFACFQWRKTAVSVLHCFFVENVSGPPEEFCEIDFILSMMSSLVILMSDNAFASGCPKKSFGYLIVIVGSGVLKTLLYCSFSNLVIFLLLGSRLISSSWRGPIPGLIVEFFLGICRSILGFAWYQQ